MRSIYLLLALVAFLGIKVAGQNLRCDAYINITARRGGRYLSDDGITAQIYDISVVNMGYSVITYVISDIEFSEGSWLEAIWNFNDTSGEVYGFNMLKPDTIFTGAGFILANSSSEPSVNSSSEVRCLPASPSRPQQPVDGTAVQPVPAVVPPHLPPTLCAANITSGAKQNGGWVSDGVAYQTWEVSFANAGSRPISNITFYVSLPEHNYVDYAVIYNVVYPGYGNEYAAQLYVPLKGYGDVSPTIGITTMAHVSQELHEPFFAITGTYCL